MWLLITLNAFLAAEPGYVDGRVCATCHAKVAESFAHTGMGRSLYTPGTQPSIEDWARNNIFRHALSDRTFEMFRRGGEYFFLRYQTAPSGERINVVEKRIDYILGSGNHARTYLHRTPQGRLLDLPVAWYSEKSGYWAMAPGYDRPDHADYRREVNDNCRFCHTAYPRVGATAPEPIDCQRCHGPGERHATAPSRANIVNPARLNADRKMDVCLQCHLQSTSQGVWMTHRPGRGVFSFRAGEPLENYASHSKGNNEGFEVNHAGYRLLSSECFRKSKGKLTCVTCHDPHARQVKFACANCHQDPRHGGDCVSCHMPKRRTEDAVHVVMTDHRIVRREEPRPARRIEFPQPPNVQSSLNIRGESLYRQGRFVEAIALLEQAIAENPDLPEAHINLGAALSAKGEATRAEQAFGEAIRIAPEYAAAHNNLANLIAASGDFEKAEYHFRKAIALDPGYHAAYFNYGRALAIRGRKREAETYFRKAKESTDAGLRQAAERAMGSLK